MEYSAAMRLLSGLGMFGDGGRVACGWLTAAKWISCGGFPAVDGFGLENWVSSGL